MTPATGATGRLTASLCATALAASIGCHSKPAMDPAAADPAAATQETERWRARHEADYRRDWVTIAGLHFLEPGPNTAGSASTNDIVLPASAPATIGRFVLDGTHVRFEPAPGSRVVIGADPVTNATVLQDDMDPEPDRLAVGDIEMVVHRSGTRESLRVWDATGPLATGFLGFTWFPIDLSYRVTGRFIPDETPRELPITNTFGDQDTFKTEGVVEFTLQGQPLRLRAFTTQPKRLYFVFRDASGGHETYEAARFLYSDLRDDGTTVLDFNQAYNPPCAFNPYTTCPIPLRENRLPVKILAGEKAYPVHPTLPS